MKGIIWVIACVLCIGCNVSNTEPEFEYDWEQVLQFERDQITAIHVSQDDQLYVATGKKLYRSFDLKTTYLRMQSPDSAKIFKIKTFDDRIIILGDVFQRDIGNFGDDVGFVYQSLDDGLTWQEVISGFVMQDVTYHNNRIHIGRTHGVTTVDLETGEIIQNQIVDSKLSDHMEEIAVSPNGDIVVSCHDGVFLSDSNGDNWVEIATEIQKDDDWIESIEFSGNELYALESSRVYRIDLITDEVESFKGNIGYEQLELTQTGEVIKMGSTKLGVAYQNELDFENIYPVNLTEERLFLDFVDSFSDGTLAITAEKKLFIVERVQ